MDKKPWHYLRPNHAARTPRRVIVVAVEPRIEPDAELPFGERWSLAEGHAVYLRLRRGVETSRAELTFSSAGQFWEFVEYKLHRREKLWVFVQGASVTWPLVDLWRWIQDRGLKVKSYVAAGPPAILDCTLRSCSITIADTQNYWRLTGFSLGSVTGAGTPPRQAVPAESVATGSSAKESAYESTAKILSLIRAVAQGDLGCWAPTISGIAWHAYTHRFMPTKWIRNKPWADSLDGESPIKQVGIICPHGNVEVTALERECYRGGRADCHYLGEVDGPIYHLDFNSFYSSVMRSGIYPVRLRAVHAGANLSRLRSLAEEGSVVARVTLQSLDTDYPHTGRAGRGYARGAFTTVLATPEVLYALERSQVKSCSYVACYEGGRPFADFVDYFYRKRMDCRLAGDVAGETSYKLILESLYGKFAQRGRSWEPAPKIRPMRPIGEWWDRDLETSERIYCRSLGGCVYRQVQAGEWIHSFPAIAAHVTSYGRVAMLRLAEVAAQGRVYYEDTDSIHCDEPAYRAVRTAGLVEPGQLGKLKIAGVADFACYRGVRDYEFGPRECRAGVKPAARPVSQDTAVQTAVPGLASQIAGGGPHTLRVDLRALHFRHDHYAGRVDAEGWVKPTIISD